MTGTLSLMSLYVPPAGLFGPFASIITKHHVARFPYAPQRSCALLQRAYVARGPPGRGNHVYGDLYNLSAVLSPAPMAPKRARTPAWRARQSWHRLLSVPCRMLLAGPAVPALYTERACAVPSKFPARKTTNVALRDNNLPSY